MHKMKLTEPQKRKIINDAPMGAKTALIGGGFARYSDLVFSNNHYEAFNLELLQKEVDAKGNMLAIVEIINKTNAKFPLLDAAYNTETTHVAMCAYERNGIKKGHVYGIAAEHSEKCFPVSFTVNEYNQCVSEMTGCKAAHAEWLAEVNAKRDRAIAAAEREEMAKALYDIHKIMWP